MTYQHDDKLRACDYFGCSFDRVDVVFRRWMRLRAWCVRKGWQRTERD
jgi:hypothetical protein